ncbi:rhodanese-like domain-containing protein [Streptomyces sp900116325]|uniref:rhodanese-like domain-containing protein n=1 Tax=Streptomyces sp. 900116325 TaxID=3154295 RepID=UPI0033A4FE7F
MSLFRDGENRVTVDDAHRHTQGADAPAVLLDVREQAEWDAGHAPNAVFAPLSALAAGAALPTAAQGRPLVVICRSGNRSQKAARLLAERGEQAVDVVGGMKDWAAAGHPVVDERGNNGSIA